MSDKSNVFLQQINPECETASNNQASTLFFRKSNLLNSDKVLKVKTFRDGGERWECNQSETFSLDAPGGHAGGGRGDSPHVTPQAEDGAHGGGECGVVAQVFLILVVQHSRKRQYSTESKFRGPKIDASFKTVGRVCTLSVHLVSE